VVFQATTRKQSLADPDPWQERARLSLVASLAKGVTKDRAAVAAATVSPWAKVRGNLSLGDDPVRDLAIRYHLPSDQIDRI
jgi:hypothetical protein